MVKTILWTIVCLFFTFIWRLAITVAAICALALVGIAMALNLCFNGPSESARDTLALTLAESSQTQHIPSYFLEDEELTRITAAINAPTGLCSTDAIFVGTADPDQWVAFPTGVCVETVQKDTFTATVTLLRSSEGLSFSRERIAGKQTIITADMHNGVNYAAFMEDGRLLISDDFLDLVGIDTAAIVRCGPVLIQNGMLNEALYASPSGYAPRAAIGQCSDGTLILVTTDGWNENHIGAVYQDLTNIMTQYGAHNACVLHRDTAVNEE